MTAEAETDRMTRLLEQRIGLRVDSITRQRLRRAAERARPEGVWTRALGGDPGALEDVVDHITVQESAFFRHAEHFDVLAEYLVSASAAGLAPAERVIWSAGCANGEEAWSLAMLLEEVGATGWRVLATDISAAALARARAGVYPGRRVAQLSRTRRQRFLRPAGDDAHAVVDTLRRRVRFLRHNLAAEPPPPEARRYPVVYCRNVLIYLRPDDQRRLLDDLRERMPPDGLLIIGGAESITPSDPAFTPERHRRCFVYRPRADAAEGRAGGAGDAPATPPATAPPAPAVSRVQPQPARPPAAREARGYVADGERRAAAGDHAGAATAFRRAVFVDPTQPMHQVRLALALDAAGDPGAMRAFRAARTALRHAGGAGVAPDLDGWSPDELDRMLAARLDRTP